MLRLGNGVGLRSPRDLVLFRCQVLGFLLDLVQQPDVLQCLLGQRALIGDVYVVELAPGMHHAAGLGDAFAEPRKVRACSRFEFSNGCFKTCEGGGPSLRYDVRTT